MNRFQVLTSRAFRLRFAGLAVVLLYLLAGAFAASPAVAWEHSDLQKALQATVQILVPDNNGDLCCTGSGTILDAEKGLILTNFHVMGDAGTGKLYNDDGLAMIGVMSKDLKGTPVMKYMAQLVDGTQPGDLCVLKIVGLLDDPKAKLPKNLGLVAIGRGKSEDLLPGDPLAVVGYPGLGGSTVTFTDGVVSGFLDEDQDGVYEWIKTDTEVNPGNSGGLAINAQGDFVGVPTAGYSRSDVAGKISLIRPGAIALEFYDRAALGQGGGKTKGQGGKAIGRTIGSSTSGASFGAVTFASDITDDGQPINPGNTLVDVKTVYAFFDVSGMQNGMAWKTRWMFDGDEVLNEDQTWDAGDVSSTWVSLTHPDGLPQGKFTLELYIDGKKVQDGSFTVAARGGRNAVKPVNVAGVAHDADSARKMISGALVVFLNPGTAIQDWIVANYDETMVFASGTSARNGEFQLDNKVMPGERYSVVVVHDEYKPIQVDDYEIPADTDDPYQLDVAMEHN